nr:hypothetical protein BaRGS_029706 [Batillaria attramentaria]
MRLRPGLGLRAEAEARYILAEEKRTAIGKIKSRIRALPAVREKVEPIVIDKSGRQKVSVDAIVSVLAVHGVDDARQTVTTGVYLRLQWQDKSLAWNASDHHDVMQVLVPAVSMWTPTLRVGNSPDQRDIGEDVADLVVSYDGNITLHLPVYLETLCSFNLTHYPYDEQVCPISIVSIVDDLGWGVQLSEARGLADSLGMVGDWDIVSTAADAVHLPGDQQLSLKIWVHVRRKTTFYTVCLVLPMVLTSYMNTLVFLVPLQSGEKVSFLVTIFVSTSVFISYFTAVMPRGLDSVPNTLKLLIGVIVESLLVLLATIVVLRKYQKEEKDGCLHRCSSCLAVSSSTTTTADLRRTFPKFSAESLDLVFFVLAFIGNTTFLGTLLYVSLLSQETA